MEKYFERATEIGVRDSLKKLFFYFIRTNLSNNSRKKLFSVPISFDFLVQETLLKVSLKRLVVTEYFLYLQV